MVPRGPVGVTAPVTYRTERLAPLLREGDATSLINPNLFHDPPCATQPTLAAGVVEAPSYVVWFDHPFQPDQATSPFRGVGDLFPVQRLPLADGPNPPAGVEVYEIDRRIRGAERVAPDSQQLIAP